MSTHIDPVTGKTIDDATGLPVTKTADPSGVEPIQVRKSRLAEENRQRTGVVHSSADRAKAGVQEATAEELAQDRKARGLQP